MFIVKILMNNDNKLYLIFYNSRVKKIKENRRNLIHITDCILVCGRQEIALRGHRVFGAFSFDGKFFFKLY